MKKQANQKEKKIHGFEYDLASGTLKEVKDYKSDKPYPRWANISPDKICSLLKRFQSILHGYGESRKGSQK